jgi:hypothetical protein
VAVTVCADDAFVAVGFAVTGGFGGVLVGMLVGVLAVVLVVVG